LLLQAAAAILGVKMSHSFLETPHLYRHRYDIDDVIARLCADIPSVLDTGAGRFPLEPLPVSYLAETPAHPSFAKLPPETQAAVRDLIANTQHLSDLLPQFGATPAAEWLRERLKDAALEWLDASDLIPPSMKHYERRTLRPKATAGKVNIV
jgi:hypothetical protein